MRRMSVWLQFRASVRRGLEFDFRVVRDIGCFSGNAIITRSPSPQVCDAATFAAEREAFIRSGYCLFTAWAAEGERVLHWYCMHYVPIGTSILAYG
jgi:hypothetical protein